MRVVDLLVVYGVLGIACAIAIYRISPERGARAALRAALTIPIWPLWAPIALMPEPKDRALAHEDSLSTDAAARVNEALREGIEACAGTSLEPLLSREAGARITTEVDRAARRLADLDAMLKKGDFDLKAAEARVAELERDKASARAIATAKLQVDNIKRLYAMRERDARALDELVDLVQALKAQLALARFAGSSLEGASGIVSEVWARVEGLGDALDASTAEPEQAARSETTTA